MPEPSSRWPEIDRLLARLAEHGLHANIGMRLQIDHLLARAGVPERREAFIAHVEREGSTLRWLLGAVLVKSIEQDVLFAGVFAAWSLSLPRAGPRRPEIPARHHAYGTAVRPGKRRARAAIVALGLTNAILVLVAVKLWMSPVTREEPGGLEDDATETTPATPAPPAIEAEPGQPGPEPTNSGDANVPPQGAPRARLEAAGTEAKRERPTAQVFPVPQITLVPHSVDFPWPALFAALAALVTAIALTVRMRRTPLLPSPDPAPRDLDREPSLPVLDRGGSLLLLDRETQDTLIWGIGQQLSDQRTTQLDLARTIADTAAQGGVPTLHFERLREHAGVWLWNDTAARPQEDIVRLADEIERTLDLAGLPVHRVSFHGIPELLVGRDGECFRPGELDEQQRSARVVILTDGRLLAHHRTSILNAPVVDLLLDELAGWPHLAFVDFAGERGPLRYLLGGSPLRRIEPADAVPHLAGAASSLVHRAGTSIRDWELACALAPGDVREDDALALLPTLDLAARPWALELLRARAPGPAGKLHWGTRTRAALFTWYARATGYPAGELPPLLSHALGFWDEHYAAIEQQYESDDAWRGSADALRLAADRQILALWTAPETATKRLHSLAGAGLAGHIRERLAGYTDASAPVPDQIQLPWRLAARSDAVRFMLGELGFMSTGTPIRLRHPGRRAVAIGLCAGVALVLGAPLVRDHVVLSREVRWAISWTRAPLPGMWAHCTDMLPVVCTVGSPTIAVSQQSDVPVGHVELAWSVQTLPCEETFGDPNGEPGLLAHLYRCSMDGVPRVEPDRPPLSQIQLRPFDDKWPPPAAAYALLDTGSADAVVIGWSIEEILGGAGALTAPGQRMDLLAVGDLGESKYRWLTRSDLALPSWEDLPNALYFSGLKASRDVWPMVEDPAARPVLLQGYCPASMATILRPGTNTAFCLDRSEVTVAEYYADEDQGEDVRGVQSCNTDVTMVGNHPVNCVMQDAADAHCRARQARLPTLGEWTLAALGSPPRRFPWGDAAADLTRGNFMFPTMPVGSFPAGDVSESGVHDMAGNVAEWVSGESDDNEMSTLSVDIDPRLRSSERPTLIKPMIGMSALVGFRCARSIEP